MHQQALTNLLHVSLQGSSRRGITNDDDKFVATSRLRYVILSRSVFEYKSSNEWHLQSIVFTRVTALIAPTIAVFP